MSYQGDFAEDAVLYFKFSTRRFSSGATFTLAGSPVLSVYKDEDTGTEKTTAEAYFDLDVDFDSVAGLNNVRIDLSGDAFFATGADYSVVITTGTVDSVSVVGEVVGEFSIENRFMRGTDSANTTVPDAAGVAPTAVEVRQEMDSNSTELAKIGTIPALDGGGQTIGAAIAKIADDNGGADFDAGTDSLQELRDHIGDGTNLTEAGGDGDHLAEVGLADGAITAAKIAADAITEAKIADDAIAAEHIAAGAIVAATFANNAIAAAAIAADAITAAKLATGALTADAFAADALVAATFATGAFTADAFAANALIAATFAAASLDGKGDWNTTVPDAAGVAPTSGEIKTAIEAAGSHLALIKAITDALGATAAARLALSMSTAIPGTVSHDNTAASTTVFYSDDITEATADHFNKRVVYFTSGALVGQATDIGDYELDTGEGKFTVTALTEAPADNVTFIIL